MAMPGLDVRGNKKREGEPLREQRMARYEKRQADCSPELGVVWKGSHGQGSRPKTAAPARGDARMGRVMREKQEALRHDRPEDVPVAWTSC